jgi:hypothetical protein
MILVSALERKYHKVTLLTELLLISVITYHTNVRDTKYHKQV